MSTLWCYSSPAALWCGEVLVDLLEMLVGLLVGLHVLSVVLEECCLCSSGAAMQEGCVSVVSERTSLCS